jgi:hypothetical protein
VKLAKRKISPGEAAMPLLESLAAGLAPVIIKSLAKIWLKDEGLVEATKSLSEIATKRFQDVLTTYATDLTFWRQKLQNNLLNL